MTPHSTPAAEETQLRYDTSVVSLAQVVLFAPDVFLKPTKSGRGRLTISPELSVLIEEDVADDLLRTRELLRAFVDSSVGRKPTAAAARACDALARGAASEVNRGTAISSTSAERQHNNVASTQGPLRPDARRRPPQIRSKFERC